MELRGLARRVAEETDDVLSTIQLVRGNDELTGRLFDQLVDLLVESAFLDLRHRLAEGSLSADEYATELADLAMSCRAVGLLPLPSGRR